MQDSRRLPDNVLHSEQRLQSVSGQLSKAVSTSVGYQGPLSCSSLPGYCPGSLHKSLDVWWSRRELHCRRQWGLARVYMEQEEWECDLYTGGPLEAGDVGCLESDCAGNAGECLRWWHCKNMGSKWVVLTVIITGRVFNLKVMLVLLKASFIKDFFLLFKISISSIL